MFLEIKNLRVKKDNKEILRGVNLQLKKGEIQALLGPNGSGKSVFAQTILGNPRYKTIEGKILFENQNIVKLSPEKRVKLGMALSWQNPPSIKGVKLSELIGRISKKEIDGKKLGLNSDLLGREVNLDYSGGERRLSELLQILSLDPKLVIFDEIDSGLDIKRLEKVAKIIKKELMDRGVAILLITHSGEILRFLKPEITNVMIDGKIICRQKNYKKVLRTIKKYGYEKCEKRALSSD